MAEFKNEDLLASDAAKFFDNICDETGRKLVKAEKRSRLMTLMRDLYYNHPDKNICCLQDGKTVPVIIAKRHPKRGEFCYFNTENAPRDEILCQFAEKMNITCKLTRPEPKKDGELIVSDIKHLMDDVTVDGQKVSDFRKQEKLNELFAQLYNSPKDNVCHIPEGKDIPIVVERLSVNNWNFLCLNTSEYRTAVLSAFADFAGCIYCQEKENAIIPPERQKTEMTARECARIFHGVPNLDGGNYKRDASPKLVEWFAHIYNRPKLNRVVLPDGKEEPLLVYRQSCSQKCLCLNTSDERVKPFVIKRMAEITEATICLDNLKIHSDNPQNLHKSIMTLVRAAQHAKRMEEITYYRTYAQKIRQVLSPQSKEFTIEEWIINHTKKSK